MERMNQEQIFISFMSPEKRKRVHADRRILHSGSYEIDRHVESKEQPLIEILGTH
jgi:hypothetical protein